ncbi:MAG: hypothetical protein R3B74_10090 [Nitrospirales bacterium]|nr:hypothetical protein [Nitrospirales bacterium]
MNINSYLETVSQWLPLASLIIALIALLLSFLSSRIAKKSYALSLEQERRTQPSLELYIVDSYIRPASPPIPRIFFFQVRLTNTSDASNSVREVRLVIEYGKERGVSSTVAIPHKIDHMEYLKPNRHEPLNPPFSIAARSVLGGVAVFSLPDDLTKKSVVESYTVEVVDAFGLKAGAEAILLKELVDESVEKASLPSQK